MRLFPGLVVFALGLTIPLSAKGPTTKIVVTGASLTQPIEITDAAVLRPFLVWAGAGTRTCVGGITNCIEGTTGFIVDWVNGPVDAPPSGLTSYVVAFYSESGGSDRTAVEELAYVVRYVYDASTRKGYVYLPGKGEPNYELNTSSIRRGVEGRWFGANLAWQTSVDPLISRYQVR